MKIAALIILTFVISVQAQTTKLTATTAPATVTIHPNMADSTAVLQTAASNLHSGGTLILAPGDYIISKAILIANVSNVTVQSTGANIKAEKGMVVSTIDGDMLRLEAVNGITVTGLNFDANSTNRQFAPTPITLRFCWSNNAIFQNCSFKNAVCDSVFAWGGLGAPNGACSNIRLTQCSFDGAVRDGISLVNAANSCVDNCAFKNIVLTQQAKAASITPSAIDIEPNFGDPVGITHDITLYNNTITNCYQGFVIRLAATPKNITIIGNSFTGCTYSINNEGQNVNIQWNKITNSIRTAIGSDNGGTGTIQNNTLINCPSTIYTEAGNTVGINSTK